MIIDLNDLDGSRRRHYPELGIAIRSRTPEGYEPVDINHLTRKALLRWVRGESTPRLLNLVLVLLNHAQEEEG